MYGGKYYVPDPNAIDFYRILNSKADAVKCLRGGEVPGFLINSNSKEQAIKDARQEGIDLSMASEMPRETAIIEAFGYFES